MVIQMGKVFNCKKWLTEAANHMLPQHMEQI